MHPLRSVPRRGALLVLTATLVLTLAACGGTASTIGPTVAVTDGVIEISADDLAFDAGVIEAPAGEAFVIRLANLESDPHNISVYTEEGGEIIVQGNIITEGETDEVEVPALEPGEYFFVCDVHPVEMTGTLVVGS